MRQHKSRATTKRRKTRLMSEIRQTYQDNPSLVDLAYWTGIPHCTLWRYVNALEKAGRLTVQNRGQNRIDGSPLKVIPREALQNPSLEFVDT